MATFDIRTFGCQMNVHDSERLEEVLRRSGHARVDAAEAPDVVLLNTCSIREKAEQKLRSEVGRLAVAKRERPDMLIVVAGCLAQQEGERLMKRLPAIDLMIGPDNIPELPDLLADALLGGPPAVRTVFDTDAPRFLTAPHAVAGQPTAYVTTMKGCNERCTYCIVPRTRGRERYRPSQEIVDEIRVLAETGVAEVTLLGQTVNSYRDPTGRLSVTAGDDPDESAFAALIRAILDQVPQLHRLRYTSPHPRHLTPSLIAAHRDLAPRLVRHIHLPVQSGSDRMLKRMARRYRRAEFVARLERLQAAVPGLTWSTDIIVGFSRETEEDFAETLSLVEDARPTGVFAFKYSPRPFTPALRMGDDVPESVKSERLSRLFAVSERLVGAHLQGMVASRQRVLVEGPSKARPENWSGRTERNEIVHISGATELALSHRIVEVEVVEAYKHSLRAELTAASRREASNWAAAGPPRPEARILARPAAGPAGKRRLTIVRAS
ncbi:MAG: tRNA (N6-isopentenyl adenosine(37)-C2)-methylthiotransferase MiaB [Myxococcota bacterium]